MKRLYPRLAYCQATGEERAIMDVPQPHIFYGDDQGYVSYEEATTIEVTDEMVDAAMDALHEKFDDDIARGRYKAGPVRYMLECALQARSHEK